MLITGVEYPDIELERLVLESAGFGVELAQCRMPSADMGSGWITLTPGRLKN